MNIQPHIAHAPLKTNGFTLLETLMALAIMSIISLAMFQSLGQMLAVSDRAVKIGNESLDRFANEAGYRDFIGDIIGTWTRADPLAFTAGSQSMSGLAVSPLIVERRTGAQDFQLYIQPLPQEASRPPQFQLRLNAPGLPLNAIGERPQPILAVFEGENPRFIYISYDQRRRTNWPPEIVPSPGIFDDDIYMDIPRLPHIIGLEYDYQGERVTLWARTRHAVNLSLGVGHDLQQ